MALAIEAKRQIFTTNQRHKSDTGSPEVQIALLSQRISMLTEHFKTHQKGPRFPQGAAHAGREASPASDVPAQYGSRALQGSSATARHSPLVHSSEAALVSVVPEGFRVHTHSVRARRGVVARCVRATHPVNSSLKRLP